MKALVCAFIGYYFLTLAFRIGARRPTKGFDSVISFLVSFGFIIVSVILMILGE